MADLKASVSPPDLTAQQLAQESTKPQDTSKPTEQKDVHVIIEEVAEADDIKEGSVSGDESDEAGPGPGSTLQADDKWDRRRKYNNQQRRERSKANKRAKHAALKEAGATAAEHHSTAAQSLEEVEAAKQAAHAESNRLRAEASAAADAAMTHALAHGLKVVVDCTFAKDSPDKERRSLVKQVQLCVGLNKRAAKPVSLTLTGFTGEVAQAAEGMGCAGKWKAVELQQTTLQAFEPSKVVLLSPDAPEPLTCMEADKVYVIGGIVDRTVKKGTTLNFATSGGVDARRLPIAEHAEQLGLGKGTQLCPVLNINAVFAALLEYWAHGDWVKALDAAIPQRKKRPVNS